MNDSLHVLLIEDSEDDAFLTLRELRRSNFNVVWERVETAESLRTMLASRSWDVIISDHHLPGFDGPTALKICQQSQLDIPFIMVSGTINEVSAVEIMKAGANDYLMKGNLTRLSEAVRRELRDAQIRAERKQAEVIVKQQLAAIEAAINGISILQEGTYLYVNQAYLKLFGYSHSEELIGKSWQLLYPPEEVERFEQEIFPALEQDHAWRGEAIAIRQDESTFVQGLSLTLADDRLLICVSRDISDSKRAKAALQKSEATNRAIFEQAGVGIHQADAITGQFIRANRHFCELLGYTEAELQQLTHPEIILCPVDYLHFGDNKAEGKKEDCKVEENDQYLAGHDITHPDEGDGNSASVNRIVAGEIASSAIEKRYLHKDGTAIWVEETMSQICDDTGKVLSNLAIVKDIRDRKQAETDLQNLIAGTAATTGEDFFPVLVKHIAKALHVSHVLVTEKIGDTLHTLAFWQDGSLGANFSYHPTGTPSEPTLREGKFYCASSAYQQFPGDAELIEIKGESYLGIALQDNQGNVIGDLCIINQQPIPNQQRAEQILSVFAARAAAELERQRATASLERLNQQLESKVKKRTAALKERETRYRALMNGASNAILVADLQGNLLEGNCKAEELFGYPRKNLTKIHQSQLYPPENLEQVIAAFDEVIQDNHTKVIDANILRQDGQIVPVEISAITVNIGSKQIIQSIFRDLTKRRQVQEALQKSEARWQFALEGAGDGVWDWNLQANTVFFSRQCKAMLGYTEKEMNDSLGEWNNRIHPDDQAKYYQDLIKHLSGKTSSYRNEYRIRCKDGIYKWILARGKVIEWTADAQPLRVIGTKTDISDRKQAEWALRDAEAKYRAIYDNAMNGIYQSTFEGYYLMVNAALAHMYGYETPEALMSEVDDISRQIYLHPERRSEFQQILAEQGSVVGFEAQVHRRDGSTLWIAETSRLVRDEQGCPRYYEGIVSDISGRKLAEQQWQEAKEAAEAANRAKSEFLALMSHEIRTPMNGVLGLAHLALETDLNLLQQDYLTKIQSSAQSLLKIIDDILDFSKVEAGKLELESTQFQLDEVLKNITNILDFKAAEKGLELVCQIGDNIPQHLIGDSLRLRQVLMNLAGNAVKFTETGSVLITVETIACTEDTVCLKFMVQDTGIGLAPAQIETLFEAFTQADLSISRKYSGTGLGLAISQRLVRLMGGNIRVESELGRGSNFYFEIELGYVPEITTLQLCEITDLRGLKSLVVDDNQLSQDALVHVLESFSFRTTSASSGFEALDYLRQAPASDPFELVVIDWHMPEIDGIETVKKIKTDSCLSHMPRIMMTTADEPEDIWQLAEQVEVKNILPKPISRSNLFEAIQKAFGNCVSASPNGIKSLGSPEQLREIQGAQILLVEDNEVNQLIAQKLLQNVGLNTDLATNGREATEKVQVCSYDLILMDIRMPEMDGLEATRRIRSMAEAGNIEKERFATVPIVAMTAHAMNSDRSKSLEAGMNDHVSKPVNPQELFAALVRWIPPGLYSPSPVPSSFPSCTIADAPQVTLSGINVDAGLARLNGNWSDYQYLLKRFHATQQQSAEQIQAALNQNDWSQAFFLVHTLKGSAGNIEANHLYQSAGSLEKDLQTQPLDPEIIATKALSLSQNLQQVLQSISSLPDKAGEEVEPVINPSELDTTLVIPLLTKITQLLETDLVEAIAHLEILKQRVRGTPFQESVRAVEERLEEFDTDGAHSLLLDISTRLGELGEMGR
ncbi:MAG: PAS domain S-box protein [Symploca sp. SIO2G7]|nr:PAS domain S-box protein [Symploca sp. SIO2G7]